MNIAYSSSPAMYRYLEASIKSLLEHNKPTKIYILAQEDTLPFEIPCKHEIINVSGQTYFPAGGPNMGRQNYFTYMSMIRICLPELIKANKVIVLDVDTIICDSLQPLWDIQLGGKWIAMCPEYSGHWNPYRHRYYYNMGVTVMNLAQMRKDDLTTQCVFELNHAPYRFIEQDLINKIAVPDMVVDIPARYNECFCCSTSDDPAIVHYAGYGNLEDRGLPRREYLDKYLQ